MRSHAGFTLIEVLVVAAIMGILALIAIPQYSSYRERAYNGAALKDLKNIASAQESFFVKNAAYREISHCSTIANGAKCVVDGLPGVAFLSKGVSVTITASAAGFTGTARHVNGDKTCSWDSAKGGLVGCS